MIIMGCQTRPYKSSDGFSSIFYLSQSVKAGTCGISNEFKSMGIGGSKKQKKINKTLKIMKSNKSNKSNKSKTKRRRQKRRDN